MNKNAGNGRTELDVETQKRVSLLRAREQDAFEALKAAATVGDRALAQIRLEHLMGVADLRQIAEKLANRDQQDPTQVTYLVGSLFLYDCHNVLVQGRDERLHYVTGVRLGNLLTMDRIVPIEIEEASPVHAKGNLASSHDALIRLDNFGFQYTRLQNRDVLSGGLRKKFDVIVFADQRGGAIHNGFAGNTMPEEYTGGLGTKGAEALKASKRNKKYILKNDFRGQARMTIRSSQSEYPRGVPEDL